jgi:hypothetical protein
VRERLDHAEAMTDRPSLIALQLLVFLRSNLRQVDERPAFEPKEHRI